MHGKPLHYSCLENVMVRGAWQAIVLKVTHNQTQLKQLSTIFYEILFQFGASLVTQLVKNPPAMQECWVQSLIWEDPLEKGKATHSSILACRILWTIQSMGLQRVAHNWVTFTFNLYLEIFLDYCFWDYFLMWHIPKYSCDGSDFGIVQLFHEFLSLGY